VSGYYAHGLQGSVVRVCGNFRDLVDDVHALHHAPQYGVQRVKVVVVDEIDEELAVSRVGTALISHGHRAPRIFVGLHKFIRYRENGRVAITGARRIAP
jgi:hypothetical protein